MLLFVPDTIGNIVNTGKPNRGYSRLIFIGNVCHYLDCKGNTMRDILAIVGICTIVAYAIVIYSYKEHVVHLSIQERIVEISQNHLESVLLLKRPSNEYVMAARLTLREEQNKKYKLEHELLQLGILVPSFLK